MFKSRDTYRCAIDTALTSWHTEYRDTELYISAEKQMVREAYDTVVRLRSVLDNYIKTHPAFGESLTPLIPLPGAPDTAAAMCDAADKAGVGPMAAVAGAFAHVVGQAILQQSRQVIVENGGDVFIRTDGVCTVAVYAGESPLSMKMGIEVDAREPIAVCTSAGSVGHSKSFGNADAAVVLSRNAYLADACATRLGNEIKTPIDIECALEKVCGIDDVIGAVAVMGDVMGAMGDVVLKPLG